jgi:glycosyltransferase involved in cell wall biosynthesis
LRYYRQVDRAIASADAVIAVSECTKADLVELYGAPREKVVVIPEAADPFFRPRQEGEAVNEGVLPTRAPFVLFVGTLEPRKNLPTLLRAFQRLRQHGRPEHLVLVGQQGWLVDDLADLVQSLGLADVVHRAGPLSMHDLRAVYWQARVLAMPSIYEGFGLPIVEAMACGTPVVASRAGALPEIVGDAGLLVDPLDDVGLADAIDRLLEDDRLRADLRARGFQRLANFRWDRTARETYALYRKVASA